MRPSNLLKLILLLDTTDVPNTFTQRDGITELMYTLGNFRRYLTPPMLPVLLSDGLALYAVTNLVLNVDLNGYPEAFTADS